MRSRRWLGYVLVAVLASGCWSSTRRGNGGQADPGAVESDAGAPDDSGAKDSGGLQLTDTGPEDLSPEPDLGPDQGDFTIATYNVHNLFDTVDDPDHDDDVLTDAQLERKFDRLEEVLREVDADIVALQEVENQALLDELFGQRLRDMGYVERRLIEGTHRRGIDVAVVSRLPLERVISHQYDHWSNGEHSYYFSPDCLEVRIRFGPRLVVLFINHLISQLGGAEADAVRVELGKRLNFMARSTRSMFPGAGVIIAGDLNDRPDSPTLAAVLGEGDDALVDLTRLLPESERYTYLFRGHPEVLDYIIVSQDLARDAVPTSVRAVHGPDAEQASDHFPFVVRFRWSR